MITMDHLQWGHCIEVELVHKTIINFNPWTESGYIITDKKRLCDSDEFKVFDGINANSRVPLSKGIQLPQQISIRRPLAVLKSSPLLSDFSN